MDGSPKVRAEVAAFLKARPQAWFLVAGVLLVSMALAGSAKITGTLNEPTPIKGRGASWNPNNRFEKLEYVVDEDAHVEERDSGPRTIYMRDPTRTIIATNDSPDVGFEASINPYRGCEHGCIYCYARPTHEFLGMNAGSDFESKIMVKHAAPELLRAALRRPAWTPVSGMR